MPTETETYLEKVEERNKRADSDWDQLAALQADVTTLVEMLRAARRHLVVHECVGLDELDRIACEAREKQRA